MKNYRQVDCFNRNLKFWKFLGIYPLDIGWAYYTYYTIIFVTIFIVTYVLVCTINIYFLPRHIDDFIEELIFYFTELATMSKVFTFILMKDKIKEIIEILESDLFRPKPTKPAKIIDEAKKFNLRYWNIYFFVSATSNLVHVLAPLITHFLLKFNLSLPICSYSFLSDTTKEKYIYPLYFYQCIGMHFIMLYNVNIDSFILGLMILIVAQLEMLEEKLTNVTEYVIVDVGSTSNIKPAVNENEAIFKLHQASIHYEEVVKFCSLVEEVFSISVFVQFSVASCIICICLFRFTMPAPWQYYIFLSTYMAVMVVQTLMPCWFGNRIMDKSCQLAQAVYNCDWTPRSKRFKSSMRLFVERANRPLSITGWKMFPLALTTFTTIINSAYSFYALLNNMQST